MRSRLYFPLAIRPVRLVLFALTVVLIGGGQGEADPSSRTACETGDGGLELSEGFCPIVVADTLGPDDLWLLNQNMNWAVEDGRFEVRVGRSSQDIRLQSAFHISNTATFVGPPINH